MPHRDPSRPPPPDGAEAGAKVISIVERARRHGSRRALAKARRGMAERTWEAEVALEQAEISAFLEGLDLDGALPEGDGAAAREQRAEILSARAHRAYLAGDGDTALADCERALEAAPTVDLYILRAGIRAERGRLDEALADLARASRAYLAGDDDAALADCERALDAAPTVDLYILRAGIRYERGRIDEALADLDRAVALAPTDPVALFNRGKILAYAGDHERALANYRRAQQLAPRMLKNLSAMAESFHALGDARGAVRTLDRAIRLAPHYADLFYRRGRYYVDLDDYDAALRDYARSLALNPLQPELLRLRSVLLVARGLHDEGLADARRACELEPSVENQRVLKWTQFMVAPDAATVAQLDELVAIDHGGFAYYLRGQAHLRAGHQEAARADFDTAERIEPSLRGRCP